jgi:hypothetical protein
MTPRLYSVVFENVAVAAAQDLFEISPADDKPCAIAGFTVSNVGGVADAGDTQEELLRLAIIRSFTTSGSVGTAATPVPLNINDAAAGFAAEVNNTTLATTGTTTTPWADGWNTRITPGGPGFWPAELWISTAQTLLTVVRLVAAPADSFQVSGTLWVAEYA